ncbi:MAG TPA: hypothetical protein VHI93_05080 [Candidatus Thermoplasmatota archaeon]|nr:hypothetical protein [Candidatus Thermoplasmatota archaeon]
MLRRTLLVLLLAALLAAPALADAPRDEQRERRQEAREHWQALSPAQRERGLERAERHGLFARLNFTPDAGSQDSGVAAGAFLRLHVQGSAGAVHDVRVRANRTLPLVPLLAAATPDRFALEQAPAVHGAVLTAGGSTLDLRGHNNPTAGLTWRAASSVNLTFTLAPGLQALFPNLQDPQEVRIPVGATHAHIVSSGAPLLLADGNATVTVRLEAGEAAHLRLHPAGDAAAGGLHDLLAAAKQGRLGATLRVTDAGGVAAEDGEAADVRVRTRSIAPGRVVLDVESAQHEGRVLFVTLDSGTFDPARAAQLAATLNGTPLARLASSAEVVKATTGAFALVPGADGRSLTVAVAIPHFSAYALTLAQPAAPVGTGTTSGPAASSTSAGTDGAQGASSRGTPGLEAGALLALGLAIALRRRA